MPSQHLATDSEQLVHATSWRFGVCKTRFPPKCYTGMGNEAQQNTSNSQRAGVNMEFGLILIPGSYILVYVNIDIFYSLEE